MCTNAGFVHRCRSDRHKAGLGFPLVVVVVKSHLWVGECPKVEEAWLQEEGEGYRTEESFPVAWGAPKTTHRPWEVWPAISSCMAPP